MVKEAFPFFQRFSLVFEEGVFILENSEKILGMIKGKIFTTSDSKKIGVIAWLMIDADSQSKAYAGPLMKKLLSYFENSECDEVLACAHHLNTASSSGMNYFGFKPISLVEQFKSYGSDLFKVWRKSYHVFDYAHILWRKNMTDTERVHRSDSFGVHLLLNILVLLSVTLLWHPPIIQLFFCGLAYGVLRHGVANLMLKRAGFKELRFQGWESGYLLAGFITMLSGFWLSCPGLLVKKSDKWRIRQMETPMFQSALVFTLLVITAALLMVKLDAWSGLFLLKTLWLELSLIFFPFQALSGAWIYRKNKWLWGCIWTIISVFLLNILL